MPNWLWSIPPHNYERCVETGTFAVRVAGKSAAQRIEPGDLIAAYLPGPKVIAGLFKAVSTYFYSSEIIWPDGTFPHRVRVEQVILLHADSRLPLDSFKDSLQVGQGYPNFGLVIQKVVHRLSDHDADLLTRLIHERDEQETPPLPSPLCDEGLASEKETLLCELHRAEQRIIVLQRQVHGLEELLALGGPNLEDYLRLAHSIQGTAFEEATRQCLMALGFTLNSEYKGQSGEIDFVAIAPFYVFGECHASGAQNVSVFIVDKLLRHRRRYLSGRQVPAPAGAGPRELGL
jgi:hypothetical protein